MAEIEAHDHTLTFESIQEITPGHSLSLTLDSDRKLRVEVEVCRPLENGNFLVMARSAEPLEGVVSVDVAGSRGDVRVPERARVMSPRLANYTGLSVDFSLSGLQLELTSPLEVGDVLPLSVSLPGSKEDLSCEAEVVWCRDAGDGTYRAGCRFLNPDPVLYDALQEWLQNRLGRALRFRSPRPAPVAPPPPEVVAAPALADPVLPVPTAIPLPTPIRMVTAGHREEAPLHASVAGYMVEHEHVRVLLLFPDGRTATLELHGLTMLSDRRGRSGNHVAYLTTEATLEGNVLRLINPALESILKIETDAHIPFDGAAELLRKLV